MSRNDYTKYARENRAEMSVSVEEPAIETVESEPTIIEEFVEPETVVDSITETVHKMGRVIGCVKLNVRRAPKPRAEIVCEINCDSEVEIDEADSTVDFYKICTASGIEGYCVKTYISVDSNK